MIITENESTEFRNYSRTDESIFFIRRGRLRILISVDKSTKDISINKDHVHPDISDLELWSLISMMEGKNTNISKIEDDEVIKA